MKYIAILLSTLLLVILWSCTGNASKTSDGNLPLLRGAYFKVLEAETITGNEQFKAEQFEDLKPVVDCQIPLFNSLEHRDYQVFFGLPVATSFESLSKRPMAEDRRLMQDKIQENNYQYRLYQDKKDSSYIAEMLVAFTADEAPPAEQDLYFLIGRTKDKIKAVRILAPSQLIDRFKTN